MAKGKKQKSESDSDRIDGIRNEVRAMIIRVLAIEITVLLARLIKGQDSKRKGKKGSK